MNYWLVNVGLVFFMLPAFINLGVLIQTNRLCCGGETGLYSDAFKVLLSYSLYLGNNAYWYIITCVLITGVIFIGLLFSKIKQHITFVLLIIICLCITISLAHYFGGVAYPQQRSAIYFIPLLGVLLSLCANAFFEQNNAMTKCLGGGMLGILLVLQLSNFVATINFSYHFANKVETDIETVLTRLISTNKQVITICTDKAFEPTLNYYRRTKKLKTIMPILRNAKPETCNYYYVRSNSVLKSTFGKKIALLQKYKNTETELWEVGI